MKTARKGIPLCKAMDFKATCWSLLLTWEPTECLSAGDGRVSYNVYALWNHYCWIGLLALMDSHLLSMKTKCVEVYIWQAAIYPTITIVYAKTYKCLYTWLWKITNIFSIAGLFFVCVLLSFSFLLKWSLSFKNDLFLM